MVGEGCHPDKVKVYGPGVEKTGLKANEPTYFTVDCSEAGQGIKSFTPEHSLSVLHFAHPGQIIQYVM